MRRNYPDCPECDVDIYVTGHKGRYDCECCLCGLTFNAERVASGRDRRRPEWVIER